jgi:hypothetical protein
LPTSSGTAAQSNAKNVETRGDKTLGPEDMPNATKAEKALFGERVSDKYMLEQGHTSKLSLERNPVDNLLVKPQGAYKLDGVYKNAHPPKEYIITEAKFRADGKFSASELPTTKGSKRGEDYYQAAKQMEDKWIKPRLEGVVERDMATKIAGNYERWVLVVDDTGNVVQKIELNADGNAIKTTLLNKEK